jgi:hypothetical protein
MNYQTNYPVQKLVPGTLSIKEIMFLHFITFHPEITIRELLRSSLKLSVTEIVNVLIKAEYDGLIGIQLLSIKGIKPTWDFSIKIIDMSAIRQLLRDESFATS